jgi:putative MFS transporter
LTDTHAQTGWAAVRGYPLQAFLVCLGAYCLSQAELALFAYAVTPIRRELGLTLWQITLAIGCAYALGGILQVWFGHLTDRIGRRRMLQVSLAGAALFVAAHALIRNAFMIALLRAGAIFTGGALYPATGAIVTEVAPNRYRGLFAGLLQVAYPLGWFLAAFVAAPLLSTLGWRAMFPFALLSLPYLWVIHRYLRESTRFTAVSSVTRERSLRDSIAELFVAGMRRRVLILLLAQFLFVIAYSGSAVLFPSYLVESRGLGVSSSAWLVGFGNLIAIVGYALAAYVGEFHLTRRTTVVIWTLLGTVALFVLIWGTSGYYDTLFAFGVMSMFFYGTAAVKFAYVAELFPTKLRATGLALCSSLPVNFGIAVGPPLIAFAIERIGWNLTFSYVVGLPLATAGLLYLLLRPVPSGIELDAVQDHFKS